MSQDWKDANIVPIFKKGSRKVCGNYKGISFLSIAGKIMARINLNRMNDKITPHDPMWISDQPKHHGHGFQSSTDSREVQRTELGNVHCLHRLHKSL